MVWVVTTGFGGGGMELLAERLALVVGVESVSVCGPGPELTTGAESPSCACTVF